MLLKFKSALTNQLSSCPELQIAVRPPYTMGARKAYRCKRDPSLDSACRSGLQGSRLERPRRLLRLRLGSLPGQGPVVRLRLYQHKLLQLWSYTVVLTRRVLSCSRLVQGQYLLVDSADHFHRATLRKLTVSIGILLLSHGCFFCWERFAGGLWICWNSTRMEKTMDATQPRGPVIQELDQRSVGSQK